MDVREEFLISVGIPCKNRKYTLEQALPQIIKSANESPPIELLVVNYDSNDGLSEYLQKDFNIDKNVFLREIKVHNRQFYCHAKACNIAIKHSKGLYYIQLNAESLPLDVFFNYIRNTIKETNIDWMCEGYLGRWLVCKRDELIKAGGYDEKFTVYGPEDKDICQRLHRRCLSFKQFDSRLVDEIPTPNSEKIRYMDATPYIENMWIKRQMARAMKKIYEENNEKGVLIANEGHDWGKL